MIPPSPPEICVRCGKCNPHCPSYQIFKREDFSPRGRNFLLIQGLPQEKSLTESFNYCLLCGRCERVCPLRVSFPRAYLQSLLKGGSNFWPIPRDSFFWKDFFTTQINLEFSTVLSKNWGDVYLYLSCGLFHLYPQALRSFVDLSQALGVKIHVPQANCCGILALGWKNFSKLKEFALRNLALFSQDKPVITFCATCLWMFKEVYPLLGEEFGSLSRRTYFVLDFVRRFFQKNFTWESEEKILYHRPCHLNLDLTLQERGFINVLKDFCCGSGRLDLWLKGFPKAYRLKWYGLLQGKDFLATACTGCYFNFSRLLKKPPIVRHWMEFITFK